MDIAEAEFNENYFGGAIQTWCSEIFQSPCSPCRQSWCTTALASSPFRCFFMMQNCHCTCNIPPSFVPSTQVGQLGHGVGLMGSPNGFGSLFHLGVAPKWNIHELETLDIHFAGRRQKAVFHCSVFV